MNDFTKRVIDIIKRIPPGYVMTYGSIAECAGNPRASRQVSRILHSMTAKYDLPWHRVIRKDGSIALPNEAGGLEQIVLLTAEGVEVSVSGKINMQRHFWVEAFLEENDGL
ncbi:MGMT family protein [Fusibacter paucivorans]|uniref:MGMT family protein n=1 Tax=Fusibacter paucivorans TaxID=76009 RepID=A0ABS5PMQ0_9FIRM|nr:MGMT family protein [Fusibacter paucivorans]MBS7525636.1 MGMT family protein [Fusibacter paucivorans]